MACQARAGDETSGLYPLMLEAASAEMTAVFWISDSMIVHLIPKLHLPPDLSFRSSTPRVCLVIAHKTGTGISGLPVHVLPAISVLGISW